jgi:hypothetical protein
MVRKNDFDYDYVVIFLHMLMLNDLSFLFKHQLINFMLFYNKLYEISFYLLFDCIYQLIVFFQNQTLKLD